jgi:hypothetical protein
MVFASKDFQTTQVRLRLRLITSISHSKNEKRRKRQGVEILSVNTASEPNGKGSQILVQQHYLRYKLAKKKKRTASSLNAASA